MLTLIGVAFVVSLVATAALCPVFARWARADGTTAPSSSGDSRQVPLGGGAAIGAVLLILLVAGCAVTVAVRMSYVSLPDQIAVHVPGIWRTLPQLLTIAGGAIAIFLLGRADDRSNLSPGIKLLVQLGVGAGLAAAGVRFELFAAEMGEAGPWVSGAVTAVWIALITNAFNLLDHADGVCGTVGLVTGGLFLTLAVQSGQLFVAGMLAPVVGACFGFLIHNRPPARLFLGDAGSQLLGFLFAATTIVFTFYEPGRPRQVYLAPLFILAVPLLDTLSVAIGRVLRGGSPFAGDKSHLAFRLMNAGLSPASALRAIALLTAFTGFGALAMYHVSESGAWILVGQILLVMALILILPRPGDERE